MANELLERFYAECRAARAGTVTYRDLRKHLCDMFGAASYAELQNLAIDVEELDDERATAVEEKRVDAELAADRRSYCGGVLSYETLGGAMRVNRDGVYRYRCEKCKAEGENGGEPRNCDRRWAT